MERITSIRKSSIYASVLTYIYKSIHMYCNLDIYPSKRIRTKMGSGAQSGVGQRGSWCPASVETSGCGCVGGSRRRCCQRQPWR
uniref:Uncharacterized protein n=1 Tax=Triticum urartu TaxID=4572 RepID=A0A8R7UI03_TRIUA